MMGFRYSWRKMEAVAAQDRDRWRQVDILRAKKDISQVQLLAASSIMSSK